MNTLNAPKKRHRLSPASWYTPAISTLGRLGREYCTFKASLGYTEKLCKGKTMKAGQVAQQLRIL